MSGNLSLFLLLLAYSTSSSVSCDLIGPVRDHQIVQQVAARIIRFCHIESHQIIADVLTKPLANPIFHHLVNPIVFRTPGEDRWPNPMKDSSIQGEARNTPNIEENQV